MNVLPFQFSDSACISSREDTIRLAMMAIVVYWKLCSKYRSTAAKCGPEVCRTCMFYLTSWEPKRIYLNIFGNEPGVY